MKIKKSKRVVGTHYTYKTPGSIHQRCFSVNPREGIAIVNHKKHLTLTLIDKDSGTYKSNQMMSYTESLRLMAFIAKYINMVRPTEATLLTASSKTHCRAITRDQDKLLSHYFGEDKNEA